MPKFMVEFTPKDWGVVTADDVPEANKEAEKLAKELGFTKFSVKEMREIKAMTGADLVASIKRKLGRE